MADTGRKRGLAIAFPLFDVGATKPTQDGAVRFNALPAEY